MKWLPFRRLSKEAGKAKPIERSISGPPDGASERARPANDDHEWCLIIIMRKWAPARAGTD